MKIYNDKELVKGRKTDTVVALDQAEEFSQVSSDKKYLTFMPKKKHVGEYII